MENDLEQLLNFSLSLESDQNNFEETLVNSNENDCNCVSSRYGFTDWMLNNDKYSVNDLKSENENNDGFLDIQSSQPKLSKFQKFKLDKVNRYSNLNQAQMLRTKNPRSYQSSGNKKRQQNHSRQKQVAYTKCQYRWFIKYSIQLNETWEEVNTFDFTQLLKLNGVKLPEVEDIAWFGELHEYNAKFDYPITKPLRLRTSEEKNYSVSASEDPIIRSKCSEANVLTTDIVVSALMTCVKSLASWHIAIIKIGDSIFLDKRHESGIDLSYVCENAREPPFDFDQNSPLDLALEATKTRQQYVAQCTNANKIFKMENSSPFISNSSDTITSQSSVAYRYRLFKFDDLKIMVRCQHDAYVCDSGNPDHTNVKYVDVNTLLQWSSKFTGFIDWKTKLTSQIGSILASEIKLNNNKIARWTAKSHIAGTDELKIGFITRNELNVNKSHCFTGSTTIKPKDLATLIGFDLPKNWAIVLHIIKKIQTLEDGTYVLIKIPLRKILQIFKTHDSNLPSDEEIYLDEPFTEPHNFDIDDILE